MSSSSEVCGLHCLRLEGSPLPPLYRMNSITTWNKPAPRHLWCAFTLPQILSGLLPYAPRSELKGHIHPTLSERSQPPNVVYGEILYIGTQLHFLESKLIPFEGASLHPSPFSNISSEIPKGKRSELYCQETTLFISPAVRRGDDAPGAFQPVPLGGNVVWVCSYPRLKFTSSTENRRPPAPAAAPLPLPATLIALTSLHFQPGYFQLIIYSLLLNGLCLLMNTFNLISPALEA